MSRLPTPVQMSESAAPESSATANGKKVARLANLPPAPPSILRSSSDKGRRGDGPFNGDEDGVESDEEDADSDFDEKTVNTGGNTLADKIQAKLDEREFQDDAKRQERAENGEEQPDESDAVAGASMSHIEIHQLLMLVLQTCWQSTQTIRR